MKRLYIFIVGLLLVVISIILYQLFVNPYPCSISGCGCSSEWELLEDTWLGTITVMGIIMGFGIMMYAIVFVKKKKD